MATLPGSIYLQFLKLVTIILTVYFIAPSWIQSIFDYTIYKKIQSWCYKCFISFLYVIPWIFIAGSSLIALVIALLILIERYIEPYLRMRQLYQVGGFIGYILYCSFTFYIDSICLSLVIHGMIVTIIFVYAAGGCLFLISVRRNQNKLICIISTLCISMEIILWYSIHNVDYFDTYFFMRPTNDLMKFPNLMHQELVFAVLPHLLVIFAVIYSVELIFYRSDQYQSFIKYTLNIFLEFWGMVFSYTMVLLLIDCMGLFSCITFLWVLRTLRTADATDINITNEHYKMAKWIMEDKDEKLMKYCCIYHSHCLHDVDAQKHLEYFQHHIKSKMPYDYYKDISHVGLQKQFSEYKLFRYRYLLTNIKIAISNKWQTFISVYVRTKIMMIFSEICLGVIVLMVFINIVLEPLYMHWRISKILGILYVLLLIFVMSQVHQELILWDICQLNLDGIDGLDFYKIKRYYQYISHESVVLYDILSGVLGRDITTIVLKYHNIGFIN